MQIDQEVLGRVKEILEECIGKDNAIRSADLAHRVGIEPGGSNVNIRTYVTQVIKRYNLPIASAGKRGYYLLTEDEDLRSYVDSLLGRINEIHIRISAVITSYQSYYDKVVLELTAEIIESEEEE